MRDDNGIESTITESPKVWQGIFAFFLRMHAAIEDEPLTGSLQVIAISADFGATGEVDELQSLFVLLLLLVLVRFFLQLVQERPRLVPKGHWKLAGGANHRLGCEH